MSSIFPPSPTVQPQFLEAGSSPSFKPDTSAPSYGEWLISAGLFCLTMLTTSYAGMLYSVADIDFSHILQVFLRKPGIIVYGLPFSIPLMSILLAHEMGHFIACRYYRMRCTPPFFFPLPIPFTGTLGAFIKIKSPFLNKRALFDIGIAGPLAGFLLVLPFLCIGIKLSHLIPKGTYPAGGWNFGEAIIFRLMGFLVSGYSADKQDMLAHPIALAAWVGLLVTSMNLLPIWQLDGGHIAYAILGRSRHRKLSIFMIAALIIISLSAWPRPPSYLLFAVLLLLISARTRFYHPPVQFEEEPIGRGRFWLGLLALLILVASFIPVPISLS